jgi:RNA polymerase sigma-70 factor (ECF subfamily)
MDQDLISKYLAGDEKSLEILIEQYLKPIYSFVYRYTGSASNAEDITQDVFVRVWKNLKKFDQNKKFKTWIFSIAKNAAIDWLRKKKTISLSDDDMEKIPDSAPFVPELSLAPILEKIPSEYRMIFFLRYNDHFTFKEIAESLGQPLNTVKSRHRRGIAMLKKTLTY